MFVLGVLAGVISTVSFVVFMRWDDIAETPVIDALAYTVGLVGAVVAEVWQVQRLKRRAVQSVLHLSLIERHAVSELMQAAGGDFDTPFKWGIRVL